MTQDNSDVRTPVLTDGSKDRRLRGRRLMRAGLLGLVFLVTYLFLPESGWGLNSSPNPLSTYDEAIEELQNRASTEGQRYKPVCRTRLLDHGKRVEHVVVLIHGYGNCPQQFALLAEQLWKSGDNVLVAPLPYQGLVDELSQEQSRLTAQELTRYGDEVIDLARGLGDHVTLVGMSTGGVVAAWAAHEREDIDTIMLVAPGFGLSAIPSALTGAASKLFRLLPNRFVWWNEKLREDVPPDHGYAQYSTRAVAELLRLSLFVQQKSADHPPRADSIVVITNAHDEAVDNEVTRELVEHWREDDSSNIVAYEFDAELGLEHDLLDPASPVQRVDLVYPVLIKLLTEARQLR